MNIKADVKLVLKNNLVELFMDKIIIADEISKAISQTQQIVPFSKRGILLSLQDAYDVASLVRENLNSPPEVGKKIGFTHVASGPMVRSSYHADLQAKGEF